MSPTPESVPRATGSRRVSTSRPHLTDAELAAVGRVLASGHLGMGPEVAAFEAELGEYLGEDRHVVCVNTGTSALHLALAGLGVGAGDEVLVPSYTYVATFQAIVATGARPRLCDVDPATALIDLAHARRRLRPGVKALMPVHFAGYAGALDSVYEFGARHGLPVVEDAAHAFGSRASGRLIGSFGGVTCFSFDPIKNITCGEGGAVVTSDAVLAEDVRARRVLGLGPGAELRLPGWRFHMPDLAAAIGRVQLQRFERELKPARCALAARYRGGLRGAPHVRPLLSSEEVVPHIMPVRVTSGRRERLIERLAQAGFETRIHYRPGHHFAALRDDGTFPGAEQLYAECLSLPLHPGVTEAEVDAIVEICREA